MTKVVDMPNPKATGNPKATRTKNDVNKTNSIFYTVSFEYDSGR
jgi:hypothetical protein